MNIFTQIIAISGQAIFIGAIALLILGIISVNSKNDKP
jgi:hypothetical protein